MPEIEHVVVLVLENRSFDHMLGYLRHPSPEFDGLTGRVVSNPGVDGAPVPTTPRAKTVLPIGPDHSHDAVMQQLGVSGVGPAPRPSNSGFVLSYEGKGRGLLPPRFGGLLGPLVNLRHRRKAAAPVTGRGPLVMLCQPPEHVPVLATLAREFAVCTRWFCSVPGETWPNRNYLHAATSDGETNIDIRSYDNPTIFELIEQHGKTWHIYHDDTPQVWAFPQLWDTPERHANWFHYTKFAEHCAAGTLPNYSFIEPNHRPPLHTLDHDPIVGVPDVSDSQHPENNLVSNSAYDGFGDDTTGDFIRGEQLIASVYEALRTAPDLFARTLLLITYDEHGGLFDHVPPPTGVPSPGDRESGVARLFHALLRPKATTFDFTMLGPRVPAIVVSPLVAAGTVDVQVHDHASVPATLRALFAPQARPLTARDAWAAPFHGLASLPEPRRDLPDLSGHAAHPVVPSGATATRAAAAPAGSMPPYYESFVEQADHVRRHLDAVGEPEVTAVPHSRTDDAHRAHEVSVAFQEAAHRHRAEGHGTR